MKWVVVGAVLVVTVAAGIALALGADDDTTQLTVTWGGGEGAPSCSYDASARTVAALLAVKGTTAGDDPVTVTATVTAYADENTSASVGSSTRSVQVAGTVDETLVVTIPVERTPHKGEDGETACVLEANQPSG